jgi:putative lipoprotein
VSVTVELPDGAVLPEGTAWTVELQNTSLADAPAVSVAEARGVIEDPSVTELRFAIPYDPEAIVDTDTYTLQARITDANGDLLYVNDTAVMVLTDESESTEVTFPVVAVEPVPAATDEVAEASPEA